MKNKILQSLKTLYKNQFFICIVVAWFLTLLIEILSRHSVSAGFNFMIYHIKYFLSNFSIILCMLSVCFLFKRRYFVLEIIILLWLGLGVTNSVILTYRNTPLAAVDFSITKAALDIMNAYVKPIQIVTFISLFLVAIVSTVIVYKYAPKVVPKYKKSLIFIGCTLVFCITAMCASYRIYNDPEKFANLPEAYRNYGFAYCFSCSAVNRGVDKPEDYSAESVDKIIDKIDDEVFDTPEETPNIIYVQLESFFDVKYLKDLVYNEDPIPNYTALKESCTSGFLRIPGLGGGTCNAEFEMLTGMSIGMFGTSEYPYKTITLKETAGSICYDLKEYGYSSHAVHNHTGTFYDRHINYSNLGFDTFIPVEYMHDVERNPINWAKDKILTGEIMKCLNSTENRDFVLAVSVQSHGKYPSEVIDENQTISIVSGLEDDEYKIGLEYFVNQLHEMDIFVGELIETLKEFDEPTVLVLYGDHLPAMSISKEQLINNDLFQTEYVIWSNYDGLPVEDEDLRAYQFTSKLTKMLGFNCNNINSLHRYYSDDRDNPDYEHDLQTLMYDELYGEMYAYDGVDPYEKTNIKYGIDPIFITDASVGETSTCLKGSGFTEKSKVYVNGNQVSATYVDTNTLMLSKTVAKADDEIYVAQVCSDKHELGRTEVYSVTKEDTVQ